MNRLQKRAWYELAGVIGAVTIAGIGISIMVHANVKGIFGLIAFIISFLVFGLVAFVGNMKCYAQFDEREKKIYNRSFVICSGAFVGCTCLISFCIFFIAGGKSEISSYIPPVIFLSSLFTAQFVQSAAIIIQFILEQPDE